MGFPDGFNMGYKRKSQDDSEVSALRILSLKKTKSSVLLTKEQRGHWMQGSTCTCALPNGPGTSSAYSSTSSEGTVGLHSLCLSSSPSPSRPRARTPWTQRVSRISRFSISSLWWWHVSSSSFFKLPKAFTVLIVSKCTIYAFREADAISLQLSTPWTEWVKFHGLRKPNTFSEDFWKPGFVGGISVTV